MATASRDFVLWDFLVVASTVCRAVWALHQDEDHVMTATSLPPHFAIDTWRHTLLAPGSLDDTPSAAVVAACTKIGLDLTLHLDRLASANISLVHGHDGVKSIAEVWSLVDVSVLKYRLDNVLARLKTDHYNGQ